MIEVTGPVVAGERLIGAACTLGAEEMPARLREWSALRDRAKDIREVPGGKAIILADDEPIAAVADLAARESACCAFYTFTLRLDGPTRELQITAGPGQEPAIEVLLGLL
jgi:MerR family copper efflux transcriptional regulator